MMAARRSDQSSRRRQRRAASATGGRGAGPAQGAGNRGPGGDNHAFWIDPKDPKFLLSGNDSGFRISTDGGGAWKHADLPTSTWFDIAYDMDTPFHVVGSVQDHGSYRLTVDLKGGRDHLTAVASDAVAGQLAANTASIRFDPTNPNVIYFSSTGGNAGRTDLSVQGAPRGGGGGAAGAAGNGRGAAAAPAAGPQTHDESAAQARSGRQSVPLPGARAHPALAVRSEDGVPRRAVSLPLARSRRHVGKSSVAI